jgi:hypothetical protein
MNFTTWEDVSHLCLLARWPGHIRQHHRCGAHPYHRRNRQPPGRRRGAQRSPRLRLRARGHCRQGPASTGLQTVLETARAVSMGHAVGNCILPSPNDGRSASASWRSGAACATNGSTSAISAAPETTVPDALPRPGPARQTCKRKPELGKRRCRNHGGCSTGARTPEGRARALAALERDRKTQRLRRSASPRS